MRFPYQPDQLTTEWLTDTLRDAKVLKAARVASFEVVPLPQTAGIAGQNTIIRLSYDAAEESAPRSLFAKFAVADAAWREGWRTNYLQEVLFYQRFSDRVALRTPRSYFTEFDDATGHCLLLLEDCSHGDMGDRRIGCSLERARLAVREIAKFHATWWNHPEVPNFSAKYTDEAFRNWHARYADNVSRLDGISEISRDPELIRTINELNPQLVNMMSYQRTEPYTMIHHDYHLSNVIFMEANGETEVMVIDWQDLSVGHGPMDVALLLGYSFPVEERRRHEKQLLTLYHDILCEHGVTDYAFERCWDDYRMGMFEILWRTVLTLGHGVFLQGQAYTDEVEIFAPRIFSAIVDLKSRETLTLLGG